MNEQQWTSYEISEGTSSGEIIRIVGVGGGGGNAVNYIYKKGIRSVSCLAINTDLKALNGIDVPTRIPISDKGLGSGTDPEAARTHAENHEKEIKVALEGAEMIFIAAGMGKGTGTGASPVVSRIAREMGILTVGVVTLPFKFEGKKPLDKAFGGLEELRKNVDCVLIIANEQIRKVHKNIGISKAFHMADDTIADAIRGISGAVTESKGIRTDMEDMRTILKNSGNIMMGVGVANGEDRAIHAIHQALNSPLLVNNSINGAKQAIVNYAFHPDHEITLDEINVINTILSTRVGAQWDQQIWGTTIDDELEDSLKVTVVIAGVKDLTTESFKAFYEENPAVQYNGGNIGNEAEHIPGVNQGINLGPTGVNSGVNPGNDFGPTGVNSGVNPGNNFGPTGVNSGVNPGNNFGPTGVNSVGNQYGSGLDKSNGIATGSMEIPGGTTRITLDGSLTDADIDKELFKFNVNTRTIETNQLARNRTESTLLVNSNGEDPIRYNGFLSNNVD